ncbi:MAG: alkaline phosphatase PhoX [Ilumatobacteraceae bacterium]
MDRRAFLRASAVLAGGALIGGSTSRTAYASPAPGPGPYGPIASTANTDGLRLPTGFRSRLIAVSGELVGGTSYRWHQLPDGGACAARPEGGWAYLSNGERDGGLGGAGAIAFDASGTIVDAYSVLSRTTRSCSGGMTPWGTYLSGEEHPTGHVFECDPLRAGQGVLRPLLGTFPHEMIAVDPFTGHVYMVEDHASGRLYRFVPTRRGDLTAGTLFVATVTRGKVTWAPTSATAPNRTAGTTVFNGGEGAWIMRGALYITTKSDVKVYRLDLAGQQLSVIYDHAAVPAATLDAVDNLVGHDPSGDLFVAEDGGNMEIGLLTTVGPAVVTRFARFSGHDLSEVTGLAFSPDNSRLYVTSQRGTDGATGRTYEISGPFRTQVRGRPTTPRPRSTP